MDTGPRCTPLALVSGTGPRSVRGGPGAPRDVRRGLTACVAVGVMAWLPWACSSATLQSAGGFREENQTNISRLTPGMPRDQVVAIMGSQSLPRPLGTEGSGQARTERDSMGVAQVQILTGSNAPSLYNPMRTGIYEVGEHTWEVLFYYARLVEDDGVVSDDELEPVVLKDGFLAGLGWVYWRDVATQEGIILELEPDPNGRESSPRSRP